MYTQIKRSIRDYTWQELKDEFDKILMDDINEQISSNKALTLKTETNRTEGFIFSKDFIDLNVYSKLSALQHDVLVEKVIDIFNDKSIPIKNYTGTPLTVGVVFIERYEVINLPQREGYRITGIRLFIGDRRVTA